MRVGSRSSGREAHLPDSFPSPSRFTFLFYFYLTIYLYRTFLQTASNLSNLTIQPPLFFSSVYNNLRKFFIQIPFNLPSLHLISPFASTFSPPLFSLLFILYSSVCLLAGKKFSIFAPLAVYIPCANRSLFFILEEHFGSIPSNVEYFNRLFDLFNREIRSVAS